MLSAVIVIGAVRVNGALIFYFFSLFFSPFRKNICFGILTKLILSDPITMCFCAKIFKEKKNIKKSYFL